MNTSPPTLPHDDVGAGPPLVLLHAFPLDARMWAPQRIAFDATHRVVTPDFAGFGRARSMSPRSSIDEHADDVAALLDELGIPTATVLGLSMGGYVALAFARRHPGRLDGLILADTRTTGDSADAKAGRDRAIAQVEAEGVSALVDGLMPKLLSDHARDHVRNRVRQIASTQAPEGVIGALRAMRDRGDETDTLRTIAVPTLVLVGADDVLTPPADSKAMSESTSRATLVVLPDTGHLSNLESENAFDVAVLEWLGRLVRR